MKRSPIVILDSLDIDELAARRASNANENAPRRRCSFRDDEYGSGDFIDTRVVTFTIDDVPMMAARKQARGR